MTADIILTTLQNISEGLVVYPKVSTNGILHEGLKSGCSVKLDVIALTVSHITGY